MEKSKRLQYIIMGLCFIAVPFLEVLGGLSQKLIAIIGIAFAALMIYLIVFRQTKKRYQDGSVEEQFACWLLPRTGHHSRNRWR